MIKVCKFGGTSVSDGINLLRVKSILGSDPARRYVVVSAPGKRFGGDSKVTDLLYETYEEIKQDGHVGRAYAKVAERFRAIVKEACVPIDVEALLYETACAIEEDGSEDFAASRGEYLAGRIMAVYLDVPFIDARDVIKFNESGGLDPRSYDLVRERLRGMRRAVIAGFYGEGADGRVKTFSRGGSDISASVVARAVGADLYENWTDVSGFLACDPRIVASPVGIAKMSYRELRELSYMGANVLHSEAIFPVRDAGIPIHIKNTFRPDDEGTFILPDKAPLQGCGPVTGIAGKKNFTVIYLEKALMNTEIGFAYRVLEVLKRHNVSFEHIPSGIDTMSFVIDSEKLPDLEIVENEIAEAVHPDKIGVIPAIALIAVVGRGMSRNVGISARLFSAIARIGVNVRMIDQGSSELNIIVGVENIHYERTVRAVYEEFFGDEK